MASRTERLINRGPLASPGFRAVMASNLLIMIGFGLVVPALPLFAQRFGVAEAGVGLVLTAFALTRLVGSLFAGPLIDRFGERTLTAAGAAIVGLSSVGAGAAQSYAQLVVVRGLGGVGSALFLGGLLAYIIGATPERARGRSMSVFQATFGLGLLIGPAIGGLIIELTSENVPLYLYGVVCLLVAPLCFRAMSAEHYPAAALAETPPAAEGIAAPDARSWGRLAPLLRLRSYRAAIASAAVTFAVIGSVHALVPLLWTEELGLSKGTSGIPFTLLALTSLIVVWHAGSLSDRRGRRFAMIPGTVVTALCVAAVGFARDGVVLSIIFAIYGIAAGYARPGPAAIVADVAGRTARGVAVGGFRIAGDIGALVGPVAAGTIAEVWGYRAAFVTVAALLAIVAAMIWRAEETAPAQHGG